MSKKVARETSHKCAKCGGKNTRNGRYCHACHRAYMREWRKGRVSISRNFFERLVDLATPAESVNKAAHVHTSKVT